MIHYHGMPLSGTKSEASRFLLGRHALVSFAYPDSLPNVAECCQSFVLDNGAFTVWKRGGTLDVDGYTAWVREWSRHPGFDWALIPDEIEGNEQANDDHITRFEDAGLALYAVPVWHLHESLSRLDRLVSEWRTVALGSSGQWPTPGAEKWWQRMHEVMSVACDVEGRPRCRLHGLRMMAPRVFTRLPLSSADSTNAGVNAGAKKRFGMYVPPTVGQRAEIIAERIEVQNSPAVWTPDLECFL